MTLRVWIDQDLCTGDGLCVDNCPEVFVILEDGISYVQDTEGPKNDPGGPGGLVEVQAQWETGVVNAAEDCPGECIFVEIA